MRSFLFIAAGFMVFACGCASMGSSSNAGQLQSYPAPVVEAGWIRNGDPIIYEGKQWFPVDDVESMLDSEVYQIGEYQGVQIFVDKVDTKPYDRIYTKFAKGKYRYFERGKND